MSDFSKRLGGGLRRVRERRMLCQAMPAFALGLSQGQISRFESGQSALTVEQLSELASFYGLTVHELLAAALQ